MPVTIQGISLSNLPELKADTKLECVIYCTRASIAQVLEIMDKNLDQLRNFGR